MSDAQPWLWAGRIGRPHGLDGSFHVGQPVTHLLDAATTVRVADQERRIVRRAGFDARPILRLEGCEDREAAEALRGQELFVPRDVASALEEDEWWASDLEGCAVTDGDRSVGVVTRMLGLPSCEVLEVKREALPNVLLVPLIRDAVRSVDIEARRIDVDLHFLGET
ncbi:MAG: ribosome maturation factor RimM [Solirubrobacteraceae bacterium]